MNKLHFETEGEIYARGCKKGIEIERKRILEIIDKNFNAPHCEIIMKELKAKIKGKAERPKEDYALPYGKNENN